MKRRTVRAGSALIATALLTPMGVGIAAAETGADDAAQDSVSTVESNTATSDDSTTAEDTASTTGTEEAGADATAAPVADPTQDPTPADPATSTATPTGPIAATTFDAPPAGVEITSLQVSATIAPTQQDWHSSGTYNATLTINDVTGLDSANTQYTGLIDQVTFSYTLNGGTAVAFTPTSGTYMIPGLVEGSNTIGVQVTYVNTTGSGLSASANYIATTEVLTEDTTVNTVRDTTASSGAYEDTRYQGESITIAAPAGTYAANESLTLFVYDSNNTVVQTLTVTADADGSLTVVYSVPADMVPGDYLLYLENADGPAGSYLLHVLERTTGTTSSDPTTPVSLAAANATTPTATTLTARLATTGSDPTTGLMIGGLTTLAGVGAVVGSKALRRRRSAQS